MHDKISLIKYFIINNLNLIKKGYTLLLIIPSEIMKYASLALKKLALANPELPNIVVITSKCTTKVKLILTGKTAHIFTSFAITPYKGNFDETAS